MVSEACCNRDRTQAVFPDPVIPAIMEVKGCSKRNRSSIFLLFSLFLLLISIVFSSFSSSSSFYCFLSFAHSFHFFFSTRFYKRLPTAIFSSLCSNVSCREQQSWFSSAVSLLPCLSAPVSFKDSYSKTTTCTSPSLIQYT